MVAGTNSNVFINEIHYDNVGEDQDELIEIANPLGLDLTGWTIQFYLDLGILTTTTGMPFTLSGTDEFITIVPSDSGFSGFPNDGQKNAFALINPEGEVVQFLTTSEVAFSTVTTGPAAGLTPTPIGVSEDGTDPVGLSLQLSGTGNTAGDFTWQAPAAATAGAANNGQTFEASAPDPVTIFSEDFDDWRGLGFVPEPVDGNGQLDSDIFLVTGVSTGDTTFGGTHTTGDAARGTTDGSGTTTGGVYALDQSEGDFALWTQPTGSDFTPGTIEVRIVNTGADSDEFQISLDILSLNDQSRGNSLTFTAIDPDGNEVSLSGFDFASTEAADDTPTVQELARSGTVNFASPVETGEAFTLRITLSDSLGGGSRDEFGIDNITVVNPAGAADATPQPGVFSVADIEAIAEGDSGTTDFTFTITRSDGSDGAGTVDWQVTSGGDNPAAPDDFDGQLAGSVNFADGQTSATVTIQVAGDTDIENDESFGLRLSSTDIGEIAADSETEPDGFGSATILDDDAPQPGVFSISGPQPTEEGDSGTTDFTFTVTRTGGSDGAVTIGYDIFIDSDLPDDQVTDALDFGFPTDGTVEFADGQTSATITIPVTGDTDIESDESFEVAIRVSEGGGQIDPDGGTATGTILDDDTPPNGGVFSISGSQSVDEGDDGTTTLTFTVTRSEGSDGEATVSFGISPFFGFDDLNDFFDQVITPGPVVFADGETSKDITVSTRADTEIEPDQGLNLTLFVAPQEFGASVDPNADTATVTFLNDDFAPPPPPGPAEVFINEIHYDDAGADEGEGVEVAGPAGTDLTGWTIALYNGNGGGTYGTITLSGIIPDQDDGFGTLAFPRSGIQNGSPDGLALVDPDGNVVQFLTYEGTITATNGPAEGMTSEDIGVSEAGVPEGTSLQLGGTGFTYDDFTWQTSQNETFDAVNTGQDFVAANPAGTIFVDDAEVGEGDAGTTQITFNVFRVGGDTGAVSVDFAVAFGSEFGDADASDVGATTSGTVNFADGETFQTITIDVNGDTTGEPDESFTVSLSNAVGGASIGDGDAIGTISNDDAVTLTIGEIQGAGHTSIWEGNSVSTSGIVTAVASNGFYLQDAGDGDTDTSDGIFVFTGGAPTVVAGDAIDITGTVNEFRPGGDPANLTITQLIDADISVTSSGNALPAAVVIGPDGISPPSETIDDDDFATYDPANDGIDFYESLEGMLVTVQNPVAVDSTNGFGELFTVASDGAGNLVGSNISDEGLTVIDGGDGSLGEFDAGAGSDFNPERIQIDEAGEIDGQVFAVPDVTPGTLLNDVTGVVTYAFENYQVLPTGEVTVAQASTNIAETSALVQGAQNQLSVATYNVLNLDINEADGDTDIADGRFAAVVNDIAVNLDTPDIVVLQEIQDDSGSANDGTTSAVLTLQKLADDIFAETGVQYQVLDNPFVVDGETGGQPGGNIRVAMLYNPDRVTLDEASVFTITDEDTGELDAAFQGSRAPLGARFTFNGETVTVIGNHFTSKIGSDSSFSAIQPPTNAGALARAAQAAAVNDFVDGILDEDEGANVVVTGDFNEFQFEEPMEVLTGDLNFDGATVSAGDRVILQNLTSELDPNDQFSVLFQGNAQALDHILATQGLAASAQIDAVHTNTPIGNPASDHDPMLAIFNLGVNNVVGTPGNDDIDGTSGTDEIDGGLRDDTIDGGEGGDVLTGGFGADTINGGDDDDSIFGNAGNDTLNGDDGNDDIDGGSGNDDIDGGTGDDTIDGGDGNDMINGGEGMDMLTGGAGRDLFTLDASGDPANADTMTDFTFQDTIDLVNLGPDEIEFNQVGDDVVISVNGNTIATVLNADIGDVIARTTYDGSPFPPPPPGVNVVNGTNDADMLMGTNMSDQINGLNRDDLIQAGGGDDEINGGFGADRIFAGGGNDIVNGDAGSDVIFGSTGNDMINGGSGNDDIDGGAQNDTIHGGDGLDSLDGGAGMDSLTGGAGRDQFVLDAGLTNADQDTITDFNASDDDILINNAGGKNITFASGGGDITISADGVIVATVLSSTIEDVVAATTFDAEPASIDDGSAPPPAAAAASAMTVRVLAEDQLFEFDEAPVGSMAPLGPQSAPINPTMLTMAAIFDEEGIARGVGEEDGSVRDPSQDWMGLANFGSENLI